MGDAADDAKFAKVRLQSWTGVAIRRSEVSRCQCPLSEVRARSAAPDVVSHD
jgi:hypothetical protein